MLRETPEGVVLTVHVVPRATRDALAGEHGGALKVRLRAPPVEGKANRALAAFLAEWSGVPARRVEILSGAAGRHKQVLLRGADAGALRARLEAAGAAGA